MRTIPTKFVIATVAILALVVLAVPANLQAQQVPGPHPAYLHALSDLRMARAFLFDNWSYNRNYNQDKHAIAEIDLAIAEIKKAAIDDGKNLNDHPIVDRRLSPRDRFNYADQLLMKAKRDLAHAEDVPAARGLRDRALQHINIAEDIVGTTYATGRWD
jgi:hypothetical protein